VNAGACYGFGVRSSIPLEYLRHGDGDPLKIRAPAPEGPSPEDALLVEWQPAPERPLEARLYSDGQSFRLWFGDGGWYSVDPAGGRIEVPAEGGVRREERLWGVPSLLCFLARGDLPLHASAVEADGGAILIAAPRTYGKTTMAAAFHRAGHRVLSEDTTCVRLGSETAVVPGPAMLRVRHDVAAELELPSVRRVGKSEDRVHYALDAPGDCAPVPVRAVVFLETSDGAAALEPVDRAEAIRDLWALSFRLPTEDDVGRSFAGVTDLAATVPVLRLRRPLELASVDDHVDLVVSGV
jgi:hypothetical protein